jgi:hypothetical protein
MKLIDIQLAVVAGTAKKDNEWDSTLSIIYGVGSSL